MIFLDTNVVSETLKRTPDPAVTSWLARFDVELALSTIAIAEVAYGVEKIRPDQRSRRLERGLAEVRRHFADRIYPFTEHAAIIYGVHDGRTHAGRTADVGSGRDDRRHRQDPWGAARDAQPRRFCRFGARADLALGGLTANRLFAASSRKPFSRRSPNLTRTTACARRILARLRSGGADGARGARRRAAGRSAFRGAVGGSNRGSGA